MSHRTRRTCIVCEDPCRDMVKPFGILTEPVPAHHYHADEVIRRAWMERNAADRQVRASTSDTVTR